MVEHDCRLETEAAECTAGQHNYHEKVTKEGPSSMHDTVSTRLLYLPLNSANKNDQNTWSTIRGL